jgi:hypothetical protein
MENPMITGEQLLTASERAEARAHWLALMPARSSRHLELGRQALKAAPLRVQKAVTSAIVALWSRGEEPVVGQTPFD